MIENNVVVDEDKLLINKNELLNSLEALIFASGELVSLRKLAKTLDISFEEIKALLAELIERYNQLNCALEIVEVNNSVQFVVRNEYSEVIDKLFDTDSKRVLTTAEMEVLSIIAYKQPVTKREIFSIRGIKSDRIVNNLLELKLIKTNGHKEAPGLPTLYVTTDVFLVKFGLKSLKELPNILELENNSALLFD